MQRTAVNGILLVTFSLLILCGVGQAQANQLPQGQNVVENPAAEEGLSVQHLFQSI